MKALLLMPSTYGFATYFSALLLYQVNLLDYDPPSAEILMLSWMATIGFLVASVLWVPAYSRIAPSLSSALADKRRGGVPNAKVGWLLHAIGFAGIALYLQAMASAFGSVAELLFVFFSSSYEIRWAAEDVQSVGTQLTYFGWLAIWLWVCQEASGKKDWIGRVLSVLQFALNLIYIDRTRPIWILFVAALLLILFHFEKLKTAVLIRRLVAGVVGLVITFALLGVWIGKINVSETSSSFEVVAAILEPVYYYATSGFAYLNRIVLDEGMSGIPERSLYPLFMVLHRLGWVAPPPSQINDFISVPVETNVGTFLEPLYRDGGAALSVVGILVHTIGFNWAAYRFLRSRIFFTDVAWATLVFCSFIAFFTPKFNNFPTWLFVGIALLSKHLVNWGSRQTRVG